MKKRKLRVPYKCRKCDAIIVNFEDCEIKKECEDLKIDKQGHKTVGPIYKHKNCGGILEEIEENNKNN